MAVTEHIGLRAPADEGDDTLLLWVLVWSELVAFGILLAAFLVMSVIDLPGMAVLRSHLDAGLAGANTVILLVSGWFAALAVRRRANVDAARLPLILAALFGLAFVAVKLFEYSREIGAGAADAGSLFELYVLVTGFHLLHVLFGSAILMLVAWRPSRANILLVATLWHTIDIVWLVMFPILYLA